MILELRTYTLKPATLPTVLKIFEERIEYRLQFSQLAAFWYTEIGPLNQIVHIWPYESLDARAKVRAESTKDKSKWPPPIMEHLEDMTSEVLNAFPSNPELKPGKLGPVYEMRSYMLKPGMGPKVQEGWEGKIGPRAELSPPLGAWLTEMGPLNKLIHIWPYASLDERARLRKKAVADGLWPPPVQQHFISQESKIMLPASFSPLQ